MSGGAWKPGDLAIVKRARDLVDVVAMRLEGEPAWQSGTEQLGSAAVSKCRPVLVIDPTDREQVECLISEWHAQQRESGKPAHERMAAALLSLTAPSASTEPTGPIVHAVMYRDHRMGTLCDSGAWGTPELFTAVTENVTCPGCRDKLDGARGGVSS